MCDQNGGRYHFAKGHVEKFHVITFEGAFHGRTLATIAAGGQQKYIEGLRAEGAGLLSGPLRRYRGVRTRSMKKPRRSSSSRSRARAAFGRHRRNSCRGCANLATVRPASDPRRGTVRVGRTGKLFAHEWAGIKPDIMAVAKGIGGGFPLGACLATEAAGRRHGGGHARFDLWGNPLAMAVGNAVARTSFSPKASSIRCARWLRLPSGLASLKIVSGRDRGNPRRRADCSASRPRCPPRTFLKAIRAEKLLVVAGRRKRAAPVAAADHHRGRGARGLARLERAAEAVSGKSGNAAAWNAPTFRIDPARRGRQTDSTTGTSSMTRHFLDLSAMTATDLQDHHRRCRVRKSATKAGTAEKPLAGKMLAMIFEKPSTRTRVSFDVGMRQLGGETLFLSGTEIAARPGGDDRRYGEVLSRYVDVDHDPHDPITAGFWKWRSMRPCRSSTGSPTIRTRARSWPIS